MAYPPWNSHLNWIPDPAPPLTRDHGNISSPPSPRDHSTRSTPPPSRDHGKENVPPQDAPHQLPRKMQPRRRKEKWPGPTANHNSPSRETGSQPGTGRSPRSAMRAPVKHPLTIPRSHLSQPPMLTANHNSECRFDPDHPEFGCLYTPASSSIQQDSAFRSRRDSFSRSGLSSPALQQSHQDSFSGSPAGLTKKVHLTDLPSGLTKKVSLTGPTKEKRIAGGLRPGPVQPHPCADHPDTRLRIDVAPAAESRANRPPTVVDIPESGRLEPARRPESPYSRGSRSPRRHPHKRPRIIALQRYTSPGSAHHTPVAGVNNVIPLPCEQKKS